MHLSHWLTLGRDNDQCGDFLHVRNILRLQIEIKQLSNKEFAKKAVVTLQQVPHEEFRKRQGTTSWPPWFQWPLRLRRNAVPTLSNTFVMPCILLLCWSSYQPIIGLTMTKLWSVNIVVCMYVDLRLKTKSGLDDTTSSLIGSLCWRPSHCSNRSPLFSSYCAVSANWTNLSNRGSSVDATIHFGTGMYSTSLFGRCWRNFVKQTPAPLCVRRRKICLQIAALQDAMHHLD